MAAFGAAIADEGRPQQQRTGFLQGAKAAAMGRASRLYLAGNGSRILADAPCNGLEGHPAAQASLNFNSILQCHVLVLFFRHCACFSFPFALCGTSFPTLNTATFLLPSLNATSKPRLNATSNATVAFTLGIH